MVLRAEYIGWHASFSMNGSPFFMYVDSKQPIAHSSDCKITGFILDPLGVATFHGVLSNEKISFEKTYMEKDGNRLEGPIKYNGNVVNHWFAGRYEHASGCGSFIMEDHLLFENELSASPIIRRIVESALEKLLITEKQEIPKI